MSVPDYSAQSKKFFDDNKHRFNFVHKEDCGKYTEEFIPHLRSVTGDKNIGHLRKYGAQTQYNGHAIDTLCYYDPSRGTYQSVDFGGGFESSNASGIWLVQEVYYTAKDWYLLDTPVGDVVPWVAYNEQSFQRLKNQLAYDYGRRPQLADFDVSVWAARVFHSQYFGPNKTPLGFDAAMQKHRPEWCGALGIPVDNNWL